MKVTSNRKRTALLDSLDYFILRRVDKNYVKSCNHTAKLVLVAAKIDIVMLKSISN